MAFLVLSRRTYTNFKRLLAELSVATTMVNMCVTVINHAEGLVYNTSGARGLFCRFRNIFNSKFWKMLVEIVLFNHRANRDDRLRAIPQSQTVQDYLAGWNYSEYFLDNFFYPMASAPWTGSRSVIRSMPATLFIEFWCRNLLTQYKMLEDWHTVTGSSTQYVKKLIAPFADRIRLNSAIEDIVEENDKVFVVVNGVAREYDKVIMATSAHDALKLLRRPSKRQVELLSSIRYEKNEVSLHRGFKPEYAKYRKFFSTWNVFVSKDDGYPFRVTYDMNKIQLPDCAEDVFVSINSREYIDADSIIRTQCFFHPIHTVASWQRVSRYVNSLGDDRIYFTGAYMGYGFHEDGVTAAMKIVSNINRYDHAGSVKREQARSAILDYG